MVQMNMDAVKEYAGSEISKETEIVQMIIIILAVLMVVVCIVFMIWKKKSISDDKSMPVLTQKAKILEKTFSQGNIEWYNVELEDGKRIKLRNLKAKSLIITAGDIGILSYQGQTIVDFKR